MLRLWRAAAATTGLLFAIVLVFAAGVGGSATASITLDDTSETIATALLDHTNNLVTGHYVLLVSVFLLIVFVGYLRSAVVPEEGDTWPAQIGFGGGLVAAGVLSIIALIGIAQGQIADYGADPVIARTLATLGWSGMWITAPGLAALTAGMSLTSLTFDTLPRYVGWLGALAAILLLTPFWGIGFMFGLLWMAIISVTLTVRELRTSEG
ncbi:MAG: hypothetical protein GY788_18620 [bacterium]|nr:hypothetical protein [bacterium]